MGLFKDLNPSDKIIILIWIYLVFITIMQWVLIHLHPEFQSQIESEIFSGFVEFVIGGLFGYVGGKANSKE